MKIVKELGIVMAILYLAHALQVMFSLPIPAAVLGMILLFLGLLSGVIKLGAIESVADFSQKYLTLLFIPGGVGLISSLGLIADQWWQILLTIVLTSVIVIAVTGVTTQALNRSNKKVSSDVEVEADAEVDRVQ